MLDLDKIIKIIEEQGQTCTSVERALGFGNGAIRRWATSSPSVNKLFILSNFLNVSIVDFFHEDTHICRNSDLFFTDKKELELLITYRKLDENGKMLVLERAKSLHEFKEISQKSKKNSNYIELITTKNNIAAKDQTEMKVYDQSASAGLGNYLHDDSSYELMSFNKEEIPHKANFGIRIHGDSMEPDIMNGSIVWVKEQRQIESGKIGIFIYNNEAYCKKLHLDYKNKKIHLVSINKKYKPLEIEDENFLKTIGKVLM